MFERPDIVTDILPDPCWKWYDKASGTRIARPLTDVYGLMFHKNSLININPKDALNYEKIKTLILEKYKVCYNFMVDDLGTIYQNVPDGYQAKHAGYSIFNNRSNCNRFMLGIGCISTGKPYNGQNAFTEPQIEGLGKLVAWLCYEHNIPVSRWVSHELARRNWNIANPHKPADSRDGDPGKYFPWYELRNLCDDTLTGQ